MPVLRSVTRWTTRSGKRRSVRLYRAWESMQNRVAGRARAGNGSCPWRGLPVAWKTWPEFRAWALSAGYSKARNSLDRIDSRKGYGPDNCRWTTVAENTAYARVMRNDPMDAVTDALGAVTITREDAECPF